MSQVESSEIQAPEGTYQRLAAIMELPNGRLGNAYTKRLVNVVDPANPGQPWLSVTVRVQENRTNIYRYYDFGITDEDRVYVLRVERREMASESLKETLEVPSFAKILREISRAELIEPTLKPRPST